MTQKDNKKLWQYKSVRCIVYVLGGLIVFVSVICFVAWIINLVVLKPQQLDLVEVENKSGVMWLGSWSTFLSAIASFAMVLITWCSLKQNEKQLNELKRQWDEKKRARLSFSIIPSQKWYFLKITNIGGESAFNINLKFNSDFIDNISIENAQKFFMKLQENPFSIESGRSKYLLIGCSIENPTKYWKDKCEVITIKGFYCDEYIVDERVNILEYTIGGSVVNDELTTIAEYIKKGLIVQNDSYYPIQKSLDIIAKKIDNVLPKVKNNGKR